jgi:hypothetical protein
MGAIGMGGMFSVLKVRRDQKAGDYRDPGWFQHPPGTVAREWDGQAPTAPTAARPAPTRSPASTAPATEVRVRKPQGGSHHGH